MKWLILLCTFLCCLKGAAQVYFPSGPLEETFQTARKEGKLVFLQFEAADCNQCNDVANKGLDNAELLHKMEQTFVRLKVTTQHPDRNKIAAAYNINAAKGFGTLFLDDNGTLLHSFLRTTSLSKEYLKQMDIAFERAGEMLKITELEKAYQQGNRAFGFLELLLQKRKMLHLPTDTLLNEYVDALPADSLQSITVLKFIAQMAPLPDSKPDKLLRSNNLLFNQAWYSMELRMRVGINNAIIYKGMQKAISDKNEAFAVRVATFAQNTNTNQMAGAKAFDMNMLRYYDEVKDTARYFRKSIAYYERYFLSVSPDSIRRTDSLNMRRMAAMAPKDTVREGNRMRISTLVSYSPIAQRFSMELNNGAYQFFQRTNNPYLLSIAAEWSRKALDFFETPEALDTYAKLLYKQNQKEAALNTMAKAIALQQKRGYPVSIYTATLDKMKRNTTVTE